VTLNSSESFMFMAMDQADTFRKLCMLIEAVYRKFTFISI